MRRVFDIGNADLKIFLRRKSSYIWLFAVPLAFIYLMGFANRGPNAPGNRWPLVRVENADTNFLGRIFSEELGAQGLRLVSADEAKDAAGELRIPTDFTSRVLRGEQAKLRFSKHEGAGEGDSAIIELRLVRALVALNSHLLEAASQTNAPASVSEERLRALIAAPNPVSLDARFAGRNPVPSGFNFSLPATLVMYLTMNLLIFGGASLAAERRSGIVRRLASSPISHLVLVEGKIYGLMMLGAVQILFFLAVGKFVFHVNLGANIPAVALTLLLFAWVAGSMGILVGSLTVAEDRIIGICILVSLLMAALGGCWWPLEIAPAGQKVVAMCLPTGWVLQALHRLISFGSGLESVLGSLGVLLCFGLGANWLAARLFRT